MQSSQQYPLISVIVPLFNGSRYIEDCLSSVLAQSYERYEIIVVDDGSTDGGAKKVELVVQDYPSKVSLVQHPDKANHGIAATRNLGVRRAHGQWLAFIDQDDLWLSDKLQQQLDTLRQYPSVTLIYSKCSFVDSNGQSTSMDGYDSSGKGIPMVPQRVFGQLLNENFIPSLTVVVRKDVFISVGLFDEGPRHEYEDWIAWSKVAFGHPIIFVPQVLAHHRIHAESHSATRLHRGLDVHSDAHYIISVFSFLLQQDGIDYPAVRRLLRARIRRFLFRTRSWGTSVKEISNISRPLMEAFPEERKTIERTISLLRVFPSSVAEAIRRIRRRVKKI